MRFQLHGRLGARAWLLAAALIAPSVGAQERLAQDAPVVAPGARVRVVTATAPRTAVGVVVRLAPDTLVLDELGGRRRLVPREAVRRVAVSAGREGRASSALRAARWGAAVGVALFGGYALADRQSASEVRRTTLSAVPAGALIGILFGAAFPGERWHPAVLPG